jgi:hypothetical protein
MPPVAGSSPRILSLPAAVARGVAFLTPAGVKAAWHQQLPNGASEIWSLESPREGGSDDVAFRTA